jgi:hypothetical protein
MCKIVFAACVSAESRMNGRMVVAPLFDDQTASFCSHSFSGVTLSKKILDFWHVGPFVSNCWSSGCARRFVPLKGRKP